MEKGGGTDWKQGWKAARRLEMVAKGEWRVGWRIKGLPRKLGD